jgi:hypothetical protein
VGGKQTKKDGMSGINVMIVDDSAVVRQVLSGLLNDAPASMSPMRWPIRCWPWTA